jgi:hypothetical protein
MLHGLASSTNRPFPTSNVGEMQPDHAFCPLNEGRDSLTCLTQARKIGKISASERHAIHPPAATFWPFSGHPGASFLGFFGALKKGNGRLFAVPKESGLLAKRN